MRLYLSELRMDFYKMHQIMLMCFAMLKKWRWNTNNDLLAHGELMCRQHNLGGWINRYQDSRMPSATQIL